MGIVISPSRSHTELPPTINEWFCSKCNSINPMSISPICHVCYCQNSNLIVSIPMGPPKSSWDCVSCTYKNESDHRFCNTCGRARFVPEHRESETMNRKSLSSMRPMSVSVRNRRHQDESNAEKIFGDIISFCNQNKISFVDDQFPPSFQSLGEYVSDNATKWLRISDILPLSRSDYHLPWTICCSTPHPTDVQQGQLGDCWLMAALALITERPRMLRHILLTQNVNREGVYLVRICHNGLWKTVILDDCFPCTNSNFLAFSQAMKRQLYVPLIEKACAKLFGSYSNLRGGSTAEGLQLLTGAPCDRIELNSSNEIIDPDVIWAKLLSACESKLLIGASTGRSDIDLKEYHCAAIHANHAFSILLATTLSISSSCFLLIRDPHGRSNYSDHLIKSDMHTQLRVLHDVRRFSGVFWIAWSNFLHFFDSITISRYVSTHFDIREQAEFTRSSTESVAAYYFHVSQTSSINISLLYHRQNRKLTNFHTQSFVLCDVQQESTNIGNNEIILHSRRGGFIHWTGSLRSGFYVLIPFSTSFWHDRVNEKEEITRTFTLVIHSSIQLNGILISEPATFLADCLIAAILKYCAKPSRDRYSTFYVTSHRLNSKLIVVENLSTTKYLNVIVDINEAKNIRHSRCSFLTKDFIPPYHRQLICIVEWTNQEGESAHISYTRSQALMEGWYNSLPPIDIHQNDLHTPRPIRDNF